MQVYRDYNNSMPNVCIIFVLDINECDSNPCDTNAFCENFDGTFTCTCNSGFTGDGMSCEGMRLIINDP